MISIPQPAMALNAADAPEPHYQMWNTRKVQKNEHPNWVLNNVVSVAQGAERGRLRALVINCHGRPGKLGLGTGITEAQAMLFSKLKGLVEEIYIVGCGAAGLRKTSTEYQDGAGLCALIAKFSLAYVFAGDGAQKVEKELRSTGIPYGHIDRFEGNAYYFEPPEGAKQAWNQDVLVVRKVLYQPAP